jgi:hypothetical protein
MEQQQQQGIHPRILEPITRLLQQGGGGGDEGEDEGRQQEQQHRLVIFDAGDVSRQSVQYLVDFLQGDSTQHQVVTELCIFGVRLLRPPDGGLNVMIGLFSNTTTLSKVTVMSTGSDFGTVDNLLQLFRAIETNRSITDLTILGFGDQQGTTLLGNCASGWLLNKQRLTLRSYLSAENIRAMQPSLRSSRNIKELCVSLCGLRDEGIRLIADALVGNTTMHAFDCSANQISPTGLPSITQLLESTHLRKINFGYNGGLDVCVFDDLAAMQDFARALSQSQYLEVLHIPLRFTPSSVAAMIFQALESNMVLEEIRFGLFKNPTQSFDHIIESLPRVKGLKRLHLDDLDVLLRHSSFLPALRPNPSIEELVSVKYYAHRTGLNVNGFAEHREGAMAASSIVSRNRSLRRAISLLALQPRTALPIRCKSGIWCNVFERFTSTINQVSSNNITTSASSGASAIFKIVQARPAILEYQLQRPSVVVSAVTIRGVSQQGSTQRSQPNNNNDGIGSRSKKSLEQVASRGAQQKRQRQS